MKDRKRGKGDTDKGETGRGKEQVIALLIMNRRKSIRIRKNELRGEGGNGTREEGRDVIKESHSKR